MGCGWGASACWATQEREKGDEDVVEAMPRQSCVIVNEIKVKVDLTKYVEKHNFIFDETFDENVSNEAVYKLTVGPLVKTLFRMGKASCFAYGQTGSGKTYTMSPLPIRASADIFQFLKKPEFKDVALYVSCFEIYGNKARACMRSGPCEGGAPAAWGCMHACTLNAWHYASWANEVPDNAKAPSAGVAREAASTLATLSPGSSALTCAGA